MAESPNTITYQFALNGSVFYIDSDTLFTTTVAEITIIRSGITTNISYLLANGKTKNETVLFATRQEALDDLSSRVDSTLES